MGSEFVLEFRNVLGMPKTCVELEVLQPSCFSHTLYSPNWRVSAARRLVRHCLQNRAGEWILLNHFHDHDGCSSRANGFSRLDSDVTAMYNKSGYNVGKYESSERHGFKKKVLIVQHDRWDLRNLWLRSFPGRWAAPSRGADRRTGGPGHDGTAVEWWQRL